MKYLKNCLGTFLVLVLLSTGVAWAGDDEEALAAMLRDFLANADRKSAHETFWADDLVYSSSAGLRFGKAEIMAGFEGEDAGEAAGPPPVAYSGDQVDIRLYGDTAVVAFRLVGTPSDGSGPLYYFNTGTFLKRDGVWRVVAWQATKIPSETDS